MRDATQADRQAVIDTVQGLFDAFAAKDEQAMRRLFHPEAQVIDVKPGGVVNVRDGGVDAEVRGVLNAKAALEERMYNPQVHVAGDLATLWAAYEFLTDGQLSHCGTDTVQLVRDAAGWRILVLTFTIETEGCDRSRLRP
ncbi:MAG: nuclear transport factor 2 family protein [Bacteroidota bacterium]